MASNLSLCSLLDSDKLIGSNFDNWYQKSRIVFKYERILYMTMDLVPQVLAPNADVIVRDTYQK